jgi:DNA phosphorothioation-dependent restriction protein DptG
MAEGKTVRIRVRIGMNSYVGDLLIPAMRNRASDVFNDEQRLFINLTNVVVNDKERAEFISLNKTLIESLTEI